MRVVGFHPSDHCYSMLASLAASTLGTVQLTCLLPLASRITCYAAAFRSQIGKLFDLA
jgi:hypothetical protein